MGGGLMQLVAYGAQDIYLTGNPQITFFKVVYRRHTNFSMESIQQTFNGTAGYGNTVSATISRNGDLVGRMYVEHTVQTSTKTTCQNYGNALLKEVEVEIGGQLIDKHYARWLQAYADLTEPNPTAHAPAIVAGGQSAGTRYQNMTLTGFGSGSVSHAANTVRAFVPLRFWFNRNPGLALPLIALQYHEVKIKILFGTETNILSGAATASTFKLWADYIYLDTDERRRFAQVSHEYLIEQVQYQSDSVTSGTSKNIELNFNHPVKELVWLFTDSNKLNTTGAASTQEAGYNAVTAGEFQLSLNGHDRFAKRDFRYFSRVQVWQHHTGFGGIGTTASTANDGLLVYSFALKPEEHQPSGTCNFSRIDNSQLKMTSPTGSGLTDIEVYAVNYNVLRIMSGMGGLAYSN